MNNEVAHYYFGRGLWNEHRGIVTAGVQILDDDQYRIAFAFCAPTDQFRRHSVPSTIQLVYPTVQSHLDAVIAAGQDLLDVVNAAQSADERQTLRRAMARQSISKEVKHPGGIDIVAARLGIEDKEGFPTQFWDVACTSGPVMAILQVFNTMMVGCKPQLWQKRILTVDTRLALVLANATHASEIASAAYTLDNPHSMALGFLPIPKD